MKIPRKYTRKSYGSNVVFVVDGTEYYGISEDISAGGMFVRTNIPFPVGREIILKLQLKNNKEKETTLHARVVRITKEGMGVRFVL